MKSFIGSIILIIAVSFAAATLLEHLGYSSQKIYSSDRNVRL